MIWLWVAALLGCLVSLVVDRKKTGQALRQSLKRMGHIAVPFLWMVIGASVALALLPEQALVAIMGSEHRFLAAGGALLLGAVSLMPGFIAFPLAGILKDAGVGYMVLAAFTSSLMMVGILTFPVERKFLGSRVTLLRNGISLVIAILVTLAIAVTYGELS